MTTAAEDRTLILLRHATAAGASGSDLDRELTAHGRAEAEAIGAWLHGHHIGVDEVLCSTAARAQQTAQGVWDGGCPEADVRFEQRLYNASPSAILDVIRAAEEDASVVMVIGHAPGLPILVSELADGEGSRKAHERLAIGFPPATCAVLTYRGHWAELSPGAAELTKVLVKPAEQSSLVD